MFSIKTRNGKSIQNFVSFGLEGEKEVLIPPRQKFIVENVSVEKESWASDTLQWKIDLIEA